MTNANGNNRNIANIIVLAPDDTALLVVEIWKEGREYDYQLSEPTPLSDATKKWLETQLRNVSFLLWKSARQDANTDALLNPEKTQGKLFD